MKRYFYSLLITLCIMVVFTFQTFAENGDQVTAIMKPSYGANVYSGWIYFPENQLYMYCAVAEDSYSTVDICTQYNWNGIARVEVRHEVAKGKSWDKTYTIGDVFNDDYPVRLWLDANEVIWPYGNSAIGRLND